MTYQFKNNAGSVLTSALGIGETALTIAPADASKYPVPSGANFFMASLVKTTGEFEIIKAVSNPLDGSFTIERAGEGTTGLAFSIGDFFEHRLTSGALNEFPQKDGNLQTGLNTEKINGIEASANPEANKLLALDDDAELPADIKGNATTLESHTVAEILTMVTDIFFASIENFTSSGAWTRPDNVTSIRVVMLGGGGSGGSDDDDPGGGGGAGGLFHGVLDVSTITQLSVTVGAGGVRPATNDSHGVAGGITALGTLISCSGGGGGLAGTIGAGGAGGVGGSVTFASSLSALDLQIIKTTSNPGLSGTGSGGTDNGGNGGSPELLLVDGIGIGETGTGDGGDAADNSGCGGGGARGDSHYGGLGGSGFVIIENIY